MLDFFCCPFILTRINKFLSSFTFNLLNVSLFYCQGSDKNGFRHFKISNLIAIYQSLKFRVLIRADTRILHTSSSCTYKIGDLGSSFPRTIISFNSFLPSAPSGTMSAPAVSSPTILIILHQFLMSTPFF